jgi:dTDP-4-dehydrorhamnose reductase
MRVLIVGGDGMLGHQLLRRLGVQHEVRVTLRKSLHEYPGGVFSPANATGGVDVRDADALRDALAGFRPEAVVNAAGFVKQRDQASAAAVEAIELNALFPHRLAALCGKVNAYLIHFSTDCVFSGRKGAYTEDDIPDATDLYGRSKLLGEVAAPGCITLRTSMIGKELSRMTGLLEWFLAQKGSAPGYRRAIFSGLTTLEQARVVELVLRQTPRKSGLYHVSGAAISKFDLLCIVARQFGLATQVVPDDSFVVDRSLDSSRFREAFSYRPPSWEEMIAELASLARGSGT